MLLDLSSVLSGETNKLPISYAFVPAIADAFADVEFSQPAQIDGYVVNMAGYITLHLTVRLPYRTACARCLAPVDGVFTTQLEKPVATERMLEQEDDVDYVILEGKTLDLDTVVTEELFLTFPQKFLCCEDCKGLCPKCGKNLNEGACACPQKEIDPRLLVLKQLLEKEP